MRRHGTHQGHAGAARSANGLSRRRALHERDRARANASTEARRRVRIRQGVQERPAVPAPLNAVSCERASFRLFEERHAGTRRGAAGG